MAVRTFKIDSPKVFAFKVGDGEDVYKIPVLESLPARFAFAMSELPEIADEGKRNAASMQIFKSIIETYAPEVVDILSMDALGDLIEAWADESGMSLGE